MKIITAMNKDLYDRYGYEMIETFLKFWPEQYKLTIYAEGFDVRNERIEIIDRMSIHGLLEFVERNKKKKVTVYLNDAVRFSYKSYCITHAGLNNEGVLIWLDSDVFTKEKMDPDYINKILPDLGQYVSCLLRPALYTETGYLAFNLDHVMNKKFMMDWATLYNNDAIYNLQHYTDCHAFDYARRINTGAGVKNLSPKGIGDKLHVFNLGILGKRMDHRKGPRKYK